MSAPHDALDHIEWAKAIAFGPTLSPSIVGDLIEVARNPGDAKSMMAIYALGFGTLPRQCRRRVLGTLGAVLADQARDDETRGQAAESIGEQFEFVRRFRLRDDAITALRLGLEDPAVPVRFWSVFALGKLRAVEAIVDIARLRCDRAEPTGWWPISQEVDEILRRLSLGDPDAAT